MAKSVSMLPGLLQEIADVAGEDAALKVAAARGGVRAYIPGIAPDDHWLVECVGREKADAICRHFASHVPGEISSGSNHVIPLGPSGTTRATRRRVAQALANGASARDAALSAGVHERTAWRIKARMGASDPDQGELF